VEKVAAIEEEMTQDDFFEWPLFRELRQDVEYDNRIKKAFSKKIRQSRTAERRAKPQIFLYGEF